MNIKEGALAYSGKKDLTNLDKIPADTELKTDSFEKNGKQVPYQYIEVNGWKYTVNGKALEELKNLLVANPNAKFFKFKKASNGELFAITLE